MLTTVATPSVTVRPERVHGHHDGHSIDEVLAAVEADLRWRNHPVRGERAAIALRGILEWLSTFPGTGWQERWSAASGNDYPSWITTMTEHLSARGVARRNVIDTVPALLIHRVVIVDYAFLRAYRARSLYETVRERLRPDLWERIAANAPRAKLTAYQFREARLVLSKMVLATGRDLNQLQLHDFTDYLADNRHSNGSNPNGVHAAWDLVRGIAPIPDNDLLTCLRVGQRSAEQIIDRFAIQNSAIRDLLVRYLNERKPALDYTSFDSTARLLGSFWADIEAHHPGVDSLHLSDNAARDWKLRLRTVTNRDGSTRPRLNYLDVLMVVRAFYLDIQEWALADPYWAPWAAPSPVHRMDTKGIEKAKRTRQARMHQRVRTRLPHLDRLVDSANDHREDRAALLDHARRAQPGEEFEYRATKYRRVDPSDKRRVNGNTTFVHVIDPAGRRIDVVKEEDDAFWTWAVIETLRHTGIRVEELGELTHLALVTYRPPDTGETVPLLQILPSKSNEERLLLVSPELASVLASIITRLRGENDGVIPLVARYDKHERTTGPALPHLFQCRNGHRRSVIGYGTLRRLLEEAIERIGLRDAAGEPLHFTPHDFRRLFATDAVTGGLPVHIAAKLLGHANITTTQGYVAVFQDELIGSYRRYLDHRRAMRPAVEYREPTDTEWAEFEQHFATRQLELGTCGRPYGSPCNHEHACIRCPMLRVDPRARPRLVAIIANLRERIAEARTNGWLGEIQGLETSRDAAIRKLTVLDRSGPYGRTGLADLGIPSAR
ncbi:Tyrosine recombinase XerC [Gordonia sp. YY1]|uniref:Tyr recombinase domain-containing protein n=1 Tax=Gordonia rubripertincta NBRC 101908 TaxID=1077975 RepID=A0ABQ0HPJ3_GORRU|nr:integrase [Gordonia sp. 1D]KAF0967119.1 Tyrosine recombinase XerC [Gordonia sp. YY1]GAB84191.1 hypothetical protein GORBP_035_00250 [Gordonia rubripertincta NBRC 101908]